MCGMYVVGSGRRAGPCCCVLRGWLRAARRSRARLRARRRCAALPLARARLQPKSRRSRTAGRGALPGHAAVRHRRQPKHAPHKALSRTPNPRQPLCCRDATLPLVATSYCNLILPTVAHLKLKLQTSAVHRVVCSMHYMTSVAELRRPARFRALRRGVGCGSATGAGFCTASRS